MKDNIRYNIQCYYKNNLMVFNKENILILNINNFNWYLDIDIVQK
jgi:hypothetical protein